MIYDNVNLKFRLDCFIKNNYTHFRPILINGELGPLYEGTCKKINNDFEMVEYLDKIFHNQSQRYAIEYDIINYK